MYLGATAPVLAQGKDAAVDIEPEENSDEDTNSLFDENDDDASNSSDDDDSENDDTATLQDGKYILEFNAETEVTFTHILTGEAYISIKYNTHLKQEIDLSQKRSEAIGYAEFEAEVTGQYASSQFFSCELEVDIDRTLVDIKTRTTKLAEEDVDEDDLKTQVAIQISFDKSYSENWYSKCRGNNDSSMNTIAQDSPENYNLQILNLFTPTLKGLAIDDFNFGQAVTFETTMESFDADDFDTGESVLYEGSGSITLTPQ